ncbi:hypothetical protein N7510_006034 [Penicillium lagena]|uniref:uncharacterized protein n=1 Tax=Penicillium lagena TaxID=94218 RepID=UPI002540A136|nr:uncharacterized protein N7510_006034 [Penicillium lagena]KAJ5612840.1 hypothetical protein N7510_006034 [Penicillium lagena]
MGPCSCNCCSSTCNGSCSSCTSCTVCPFTYPSKNDGRYENMSEHRADYYQNSTKPASASPAPRPSTPKFAASIHPRPGIPLLSN